MKLFREPTIQQKREKMLYQAECDLLQAESMKEAYDAQVQMLRNRIARLSGGNIVRAGKAPDFAHMFSGEENVKQFLNGEWNDLGGGLDS